MDTAKRIISAGAAFLIALSGLYAPVSGSFSPVGNAIVASADTVTPKLTAGASCGDKLIVYISNASGYSDSAQVSVYVSGNHVGTVSGKSLKAAGGKLNLLQNGKYYLKPSTNYTVSISVTQNGSSSSSSIKIRTAHIGYYKIKKGAKCYVKSGGSFHSVGALSSSMICQGLLADKYGKLLGGRSVSSAKISCVKLALPVKNGKNANGEQLYKYRVIYVKSSEVTRKSVDNIRNTAANYAVKMSKASNQKYVLCGETFTGSKAYSDCSGLTKLSYLQVGCYLEHVAEAQANMSGSMMVYDNIRQTGSSNGVKQYKFKNSGSRVDINKLEKGDLLFFLCSTNNQATDPSYVDSGIGHVGMYIGNGKFVHFTSSYGVTNHPCRIENLKSYENNHLRVARAVRVIY